MAGRRILPLIALVAVGALLLVARLYQLQILEREIWTGEAANLVRSGSIRPYTRGAILDARGRVLREDRSTYRVDFVYRDFRRAHPLGLVVHARSTLLGATVPLREGYERLVPWAEELTALSPQQLEGFVLGEALESGTLRAAASTDPEREQRRARRSDAHFYITALFELSRSERRVLTKLAEERPESSWLELAALARGASDPHAERAALLRRLETSRADLVVLAEALAQERRAELENGAAPASDPRADVEALLASFEGHRERVEDDSASALFQEASDFGVHRVEEDALSGALDLDFIAVRLGWNAERVAAWLGRARESFRRTLLETAPERVAAQLELEARRADAPDRVLSAWASMFVTKAARERAESWRGWDELLILDEIERLLDLAEVDAPPRPSRGPVLPFEALRDVQDEAKPLDWKALAQVELGPSASDEELEQAAREWREAFDGRFDREFVRARSAAVFARWEQDLQAAVRAELVTWIDLAGGARLRFAPERLDRANERARYVLKDYGNRARVALKRPSYALTHFLTLHRDRFQGFVVQDTHERIAHRGRDGAPTAAALIGNVGTPTLQEELLASDLRGDFNALARKGVRAESEAEELVWLAQALTRPDELRGRGGIESYFDHELSGRNGYREARGLQDLIDGAFDLDVQPIDGLDVTLTLDLDLQEAAQAVLAAPAGDPNPQHCDYDWLAAPTGAIVLMRVDGAVLAAASHPLEPRSSEGRVSLADAAFERTLRKPGFQPPGSSFKIFVAAWALDHVPSVNPLHSLDCAMLPDGKGAGYVDVRCNTRFGHGAVDLREALKRSCNSYFAMLGEHFTAEDWRAVAREFGFGQPTGVRALGRRPGLAEDTFPSLFEAEPTGRSRRLAGNGLAVVEATPMQLARATAALATGALPQARLVERIGTVEMERETRPLSLSRASLDFVREAMVACANEPGGSAREALNEQELGWRMAAKTGSGDIGVERFETADGQARVRKHTWLVGYFPAEAPRYALVVFCHDTLQTASHTSVWIARQFLQREDVRAFLAQDGGAR
jgi:cell division protein FtsI/penicillin-binding protein 2